MTQNDINPDIETDVDAIDLTVTTLTTTGFGDVTVNGDAGRLIAVIMMLAGIGPFLRIVQALFRPEKVEYPCPDCGLRFHDPVQSKHGGHV